MTDQQAEMLAILAAEALRREMAKLGKEVDEDDERQAA